MRENLVRYVPIKVDPPGETLEVFLEENEVTHAELAQRLNRTLEEIESILSGKAVITPQIAGELEQTLGTSAQYWLNHEAAYSAYIGRQIDVQPAMTVHN